VGKIDTLMDIRNDISVGITWIDGRIVINPDHKQAQCWYGMCHYAAFLAQSKRMGCIWAISPIDYDYPTMVSTLHVSPPEDYCDRAFTCINFKCPHNRFNKELYVDEFGGVPSFRLDMPKNFGQNPLWFNEGKWRKFWTNFQLGIEGGTLKFDEYKFEDDSRIVKA
jgi:hypothetical protein